MLIIVNARVLCLTEKNPNPEKESVLHWFHVKGDDGHRNVHHLRV